VTGQPKRYVILRPTYNRIISRNEPHKYVPEIQPGSFFIGDSTKVGVFNVGQLVFPDQNMRALNSPCFRIESIGTDLKGHHIVVLSDQFSFISDKKGLKNKQWYLPEQYFLSRFQSYEYEHR